MMKAFVGGRFYNRLFLIFEYFHCEEDPTRSLYNILKTNKASSYRFASRDIRTQVQITTEAHKRRP